MFTKAIVRNPGKSLVDGLTEANLGKPDFQLALLQHQEYIKALEKCGLEVSVLPALENFPDSVFVEDVALLTPKCAIITRPGAPSRQEETKHIIKEIEKNYSKIELITEPGTLEAGDVMMIGSYFYIGLSERTNEKGTNQLISILKQYGMDGTAVKLDEYLHLKTGLSYLEENYLAITGEFLKNPLFEKFKQIKIPQDEAYATNCLRINEHILLAKGFPKTKMLLQKVTDKLIELNMSEFQKLDGGLSCLSLRF
jgi:dimethylargininase